MRRKVQKPLLGTLLITMLLSSGPGAFAEDREIYVTDEASGLAVPDEFRLKYQVPEKWLLNEDESDLFGARSSWRGFVGANYRYFFNEGLYPQQSQNDTSFIAEPEYSLTWPSGNYFVFTPYLQYDSQDDERTHADIRELFYSVVGDSYEVSFGAKKTFWGVTESQNVVDVINQSDTVVNGKRSVKLGQPMVDLTVIQDWGTMDFFVLPYFRERTFPGVDGRLRTPLAIDTDLAQYESSAEEYHVDFAMRYSHYMGELEFAFSYFKGTSRDPEIQATNFITSPLSPDPIPTTLYPYYYQMDQAGLELQYILGGWILKAEVINRQSEVRDFTASTLGFEYTFTGVFNTESDISILTEWLYDDRRDQVTTPFENDIMFGARLAINDINSSEITVAIIQDLDESPGILSIEGSRRLTDHWKLNVDAYWWVGDNSEDPLYLFRDDDFISISLNYYF